MAAATIFRRCLASASAIGWRASAGLSAGAILRAADAFTVPMESAPVATLPRSNPGVHRRGSSGPASASAAHSPAALAGAAGGRSILTPMSKPSCYSLMDSRRWLGRHQSKLGEFTTSRINRRALLLHSGNAVVASTVAATALGTEPLGPDRGPSDSLRALIEAHKIAYAAFGKALHDMGGGSSESDRASREEERALLAICSYPAVGQADRLAKARYLLDIETRGELDLAEHMQAVLHSTMWSG